MIRSNRVRQGALAFALAIVTGCAASAVESYNRGKAFEEKGDLRSAEKAYQKAITIDPDDAEHRNALGLLYCRMGLQEAGLVQFDQALKLRPNEAKYHRNKGIALANLDRLDHAEKCLLKALDNGSPDANYQLGRLYLKQGRAGEAIKQFELAIQKDINNDEAREWLGKARAMAAP